MADRAPTASGLDLLELCIGSGVLDQVDEDSEDAEAGRAFHAFLDTARKRGREAALAEAPDDDREAFAALDLAALPAGAESEVALGWNPETDEAVRYQLDGHRAYPDDRLLHGTTDLIGIISTPESRRVFVGDYKRFQIRTRAAESLQLGLYALAASRLTGADDGADVALLVPRADGRWYVDRAELDAFDLDALADRIRGLLARRRTALRLWQRDGVTPDLRVGPHCTLCRARRVCPAQVQPLALAMRAEIEALAAEDLPPPDVIAQRIDALTLDAKGRLYERLDVALGLITLARDILRNEQDRAREPLPLSGGKELRAVPWTVWVRSAKASAAIAKTTQVQKDAGEITPVKVMQVRPVAARRVK